MVPATTYGHLIFRLDGSFAPFSGTSCTKVFASDTSTAAVVSASVLTGGVTTTVDGSTETSCSGTVPTKAF